MTKKIKNSDKIIKKLDNIIEQLENGTKNIENEMKNTENIIKNIENKIEKPKNKKENTKMKLIMTEDELNVFLKKVTRCESYNKKGSDSWGFNKGVRATLTTLGFDEEWVEHTFRDTYQDFIEKTFIEGL